MEIGIRPSVAGKLRLVPPPPPTIIVRKKTPNRAFYAENRKEPAVQRNEPDS